MKLKNPIKRELLFVKADVGKHRGRSIIVEIQPGDIISFRPKGTQKRVEISLGHCYRLAQIINLELEYQKRMKEYKLKKESGIRVKKPTKPNMYASKIYHQSLK